MKLFEGNSIYEVYEKLIKDLLKQDFEKNGTKEITNCILKINNPTLDNI